MRYLHIDGVEVSAQFSEDRNFRYRLEIELKNSLPAGKTACVVMMNPSRADEYVADKSVKFMETIVFLKGLSEFANVTRLIVVNQFAFIQTKDFQGLPHEIGSGNNAAIRWAMKKSDIIILGWGRGNQFEERQTFVLGELRKLKEKQLFKTKKHPSRGCYDGFILPFSLQD